MRRKTNLLAAALMLISWTAGALEDTPTHRAQQADRYLAATPPQEMFQDLAVQMAKNMPPEKRKEFTDLMTKHLDIPALEKAMKEGMIKHFTADELAALADFYGSPIGKSAMKKFGLYMAEVSPTIQAEVMKANAKANRELSDSKE